MTNEELARKMFDCAQQNPHFARPGLTYETLHPDDRMAIEQQAAEFLSWMNPLQLSSFVHTLETLDPKLSEMLSAQAIAGVNSKREASTRSLAEVAIRIFEQTRHIPEMEKYKVFGDLPLMNQLDYMESAAKLLAIMDWAEIENFMTKDMPPEILEEAANIARAAVAEVETALGVSPVASPKSKDYLN